MTEPAKDQPPILRTTTQARQGVTGHNVRYVLAFGVAGAIIALAIIAWFLR